MKMAIIEILVFSIPILMSLIACKKMAKNSNIALTGCQLEFYNHTLNDTRCSSQGRCQSSGICSCAACYLGPSCNFLA